MSARSDGSFFATCSPLPSIWSGATRSLPSPPGLVTNSILFCWLFKFKDSRCKKVRFQQTHNQGLRLLFLTVYWDLRSERGTYDSVLVSLQLSVKVYVTCSWRCPWASGPNTAHLVVSLYLSSSGSNAWGGSRVWDGDKVVSGRNGREKYFPEKKGIDLPPGISMNF